jgi:hypothetical protein
MRPDELFEQVRLRTAPVGPLHVEALRDEAQGFFGQISEPPLYRRSSDPARKQAEALLVRGEALLAKAYALERMGSSDEVRPLTLALEAHLAALLHTREGRLELAERSWAAAVGLERNALSIRRSFVRSDEELPKVYDRGPGVSRYDPRPEAQIRVKLACPQKACRTIAEYAFTPGYSTHRFVCTTCHAPFLAFFGEAREGEVSQAGRGKRYKFTLEELAGGRSRVEFEEPSGADFHVAKRDLLAFLYTEQRELRGVLNLSTSRLMWISRGGPCFVATAAFGEDAPELVAFRAFRDEVLMRSRAGAGVVRAYYAIGPGAAGWVGRTERRRRGTRALLGAVHRWLVRRGFDQGPVRPR